METTHNFFEYFIFLIHQVCFYTSPIDTDRLQSESKARQQIGINELPRSNNPAEPQDLKTHWSRMLLHPLKLIPLIKRYHKVNSWFFLIFTTHFLILIHFTVKAIVYTFYVGKNEEKITYFNSIYYPPLAGSIPAPHVFNYVFVALSINCLCFRLLSAHRLIKNSIINAGNYKKLYAPQLNLASFTLFQLPVREWIALVRNAFEHRKKIHEDPAAWRAHLEYSPLIHQQLDRFRHRDLLFQLNVLDYEECYKNVDCFKLNKRKERYKTWHHPVPLMRFSATLTGLGIIVAFYGIILAIFISVGVFVGTLYLELRSSFASGQETGLLEVFSIWKSHLVDPLHLLRMFEINMLYTIQLPEQFDCFMSIFDNFVLTSRANKLIDVFKDDLNLCRQMNLSHNCHHRCLSYDETVFLSDEKLLFRKQNKLAQNKNNCVHCQVRKRDLSNQKNPAPREISILGPFGVPQPQGNSVDDVEPKHNRKWYRYGLRAILILECQYNTPLGRIERELSHLHSCCHQCPHFLCKNREGLQDSIQVDGSPCGISVRFARFQISWHADYWK